MECGLVRTEAQQLDYSCARRMKCSLRGMVKETRQHGSEVIALPSFEMGESGVWPRVVSYLSFVLAAITFYLL